MTTTEYETYKAAIERNLAGLSHVSTGSCPGCSECGLTAEPTELEREIAESPHFSWRACECCGSSLGGDRHPAHGVIVDSTEADKILHFSVCSDCLYFLNYGKLDDSTMLEMIAK